MKSGKLVLAHSTNSSIAVISEYDNEPSTNLFAVPGLSSLSILFNSSYNLNNSGSLSLF